MILGKIYQALRDVANEEQVVVVVDKSSILYGDANIDLTEKLQERVRGY
jgi:Skp family chaperone for outer membrane proteins